MRLLNLLRLRRWAVIANTAPDGFEVWSWHVTRRGADRRHVHIRLTQVGRDTVLRTCPWQDAIRLPGVFG